MRLDFILSMILAYTAENKQGFHRQKFLIMQVEATVICTASGPWGLISTIEGIMVDQSVASVGVYLSFCKTRCHDKLADKVCLSLPFL